MISMRFHAVHESIREIVQSICREARILVGGSSPGDEHECKMSPAQQTRPYQASGASMSLDGLP